MGKNTLLKFALFKSALKKDLLYPTKMETELGTEIMTVFATFFAVSL